MMRILEESIRTDRVLHGCDLAVPFGFRQFKNSPVLKI